MESVFQIAVLRLCLVALAVLLGVAAFVGLRNVGRLLLRRLKPFARKLSIAPMANWHLLTNREALAASHESLFWHGVTESNTLVMTWQDGLYARCATNLVSFQAELFNDGSVAYRYDGSPMATNDFVVPMELPFDRDGDGLENSVDTEPDVAGPDAHGTNAEWYNTVCSNVLTAAEGGGAGTTGVSPVGDGGAFSWRAGVNSNAYYFVDVVAERGPAPIRFTGDRTSRLGDPVVVARAGETNRVPLLIGIDYAVTSDTPFSVSFPVDYMYPEVETNEPCVARIRWPLGFEFMENMTPSNRVYAVTVVPYDPGGEFTWGTHGGEPLRGEPRRGGGCGCVSYDGHGAVFGCTAECTCSGACVATGTYGFEDASFPFSGGECRCGFDDPGEQEYLPEHGATDEASFSIEFSKGAVIFEDAYMDSDGKSAAKRSTRVRLTVSAYGGTHGGSLVLGAENLGKLSAVAGGQINLPPTLGLAARQSFYTTCVYEAAEASGGTEDVSVAGYLIENDTGRRIDGRDALTVVRVELTPWVTALENTNPHRHVLGIGESVNCFHYPDIPSVTWQAKSNWTIATLRGYAYFTSPLTSSRDGVTVSCRGQFYRPRISIVEPEGILAVNATPTRHGVPRGEAGGIGMELDLYVLPRTVSFSNIAMEEIECFTGTHTGYFNNMEFSGDWSHARECGAGDWHDIGLDNFFFNDNPRIKRSLPRMMDDGAITTNKIYGWKRGTMTWNIPFGWGSHGTTDDSGLIGRLDGYQQVFEMFPDGLACVKKFSNQVTRSTNDVICLNGVLIP